MPLYNYHCDSCNHDFDKLKRVDARYEPCQDACPNCGVFHVQLVIGAPMIVSGVSVKDKRPDGWKDVLGNIKKGAGKTSTIDV